ncbi:DUF6957 family protein [Pseudomonas fluorescens group sp. PF-1]|jgi:hypothetical protein
MASVEESDVLGGPRTPRDGLSSSSEARAFVSQNFPGKPYCLVEEWTVFRIDITPDELARVHAAGQLPMIVFAHNVIEDSQGRFKQGDWVRSSMCTSFNDGVVFETRNTAYVLIGPGHEQPASLKTIFSFF